jgi:Do/DeqQ family serine protease
VTNNHVVEKANEITITLNDNREFTARVIGLDATTDLALLKIDATDLPAITIGDSDALKVGEWVLAVGNPFNLTSTVTAGIVSAKARYVGGSQNGIESFIQTDAAINKGNSGGALVNARGELVGINAMLYSQTGSFTGYGFAIPVSIMKKVVGDLRAYGTVQRALLGISGTDLHNYIESKRHEDEKFVADFGTNDGVYVAEVMEDGGAAEAGLKEGDVIISMDGKKITKMSELQEATTKYSPGDKAIVGFIRDKKQKTATITFRNSRGTTKVVTSQKMDVLGAEFKELSDSQKKTLNLSYGVQVTKLGDGRLQQAGVPQNFIILKVNNQNIKTVSDLESAFKSAQSSPEQTLWMWGKTPAGNPRSFAIYLGDE